MSIRLPAVLALAGLFASFAVVAADDLAVIDVKSTRVAIYDDSGHFKETRTKQDFLKNYDTKPLSIPVLKTNSAGLLQIQYGADKIWIGGEDVKLNKERPATIECVPVVRVKTPDPVTATAMGVNACNNK